MSKQIKDTVWLEATLKPSDTKEFEGREWDVVIIGAQEAADVVTIEGEKFVKSKNNRLYAIKALAESVDLWDGVKVYDNHLTQEEFEKKQGMRSPVKEWLGTIVKPYWDEKTNQLRGTFKVVDAALAAKLKAAWEQSVLSSIGLSIDTFPVVNREAVFEGNSWPIIEGFKKILSVDLVGDPAAGGGFNRLIAATTTELSDQEEYQMKPEEIQKMIDDALAKALAAEAEKNEETEEEAAAETEEQAVAEDPEAEQETEQETANAGEVDAAEEARQEAKLARCELRLERKLNAAKLPGEFEQPIRQAFEGRVFKDEEIDKMIKSMKEAQASTDTSGRATEAGGQRGNVQVTLSEDDKFAAEFARIVMGNRKFEEIVKGKEVDEMTESRINESEHLKAWKKAGAGNYATYSRLSTLLESYLGGNPMLDPRAFEAATSSSLTTVVKNTVNIMVAADYSLQQRWYDPIVTVEEVDTIDTSTLARLYGVNTLSVVDEGQPYVELAMSDEEETASFVKKGNYIGITMETLMLDKLNYVRSIPRRLNDTWYNTLSALVSGVFTVNSATGPVLADTGALFNATAATSTGGHANLLTAALTFTSYGAARTAMRKQTNQPLGVGRRMQIPPRYLLVPEDLETTALQIRNSEMMPGVANNDINPYYNKFDVVNVPDWTDTNNWALVGDPAAFPAIYLIFPRGNRAPQLFTADNELGGAMFTNDTLRFKVRMLTYRYSSSYECAPVADFRPLHKNNVT